MLLLMMTGRSHISVTARSNQGDGKMTSPIVDTDSTISAKLSFKNLSGRSFFFGEICQFIVTIGNTKHSLTKEGNIISMKHKGGKGCLRRHAERRAMNKEKNLTPRIPPKPGEKISYRGYQM